MNREDLSLLLADMLPRLWSFALRLSREYDVAADLVQRACAQTLERAGELHPGRPPLHHLLSNICSIWFDDLQQVARLQRDGDSISVSTFTLHPPDTTDRRMIDAIDRLPDAQRAAMLLVHAEDRRYHEAADVLGLSVDSVMDLLSAARQTIGESFRENVMSRT